MILYRLQCDLDHQFEGWFRSSDDYERQAKRRLIDCPDCGSTKIDKALMAPSLRGTRKNSKVPAGQGGEPSLPAKQEMFLRALRSHVEATCENVGDRFPEEARKVHYGEAAERGIYGEASLKEARELIEEGISVAPLPDLPRAN